MRGFIQQIRNLTLRTKLLIAVAIVALGCTMLWLLPEFAPCTATFTKDHNLVNQPGGDESRVTVTNGSRGRVVAQTRDQWVQVEYADQRGWVYNDPSNFVELSGACWNVPIIEVSP